MPRAPTLLAAAALLALTSPPSAERAAPSRKMAPGGPVSALPDDAPRITIDVVGAAPTQPAAARIVAEASPLGDAEVADLLARVPPLPEEDPAPSWTPPPQGPRPPRAGGTVLAPFPPESDDGAPPSAAPGRLAILRRAPVGAVAVAPAVAIAFSQPMVPLATRDVVDAASVPARITPQPPGRWRWRGTQLLVFEPEGGRMPGATRTTVRIPAGTRSALGGVLGAEESWTFETPPISLVASHPTGTTGLEPVMVLLFDQRIDGAKLLPFVRASAGGRPLRLRPATPAELAEDTFGQRMVEGALPGTHLALRATTPLPRASRVEVGIEAGAPSAEGPLATVGRQSFAFETHGPLRLVSTGCGWGNDCPPGAPWMLELGNDLAVDSVAGRVRIAPRLPEADIRAAGRFITIRGRPTARTTYRITLAAGIEDVHGQRLARPVSATIAVGDAERQLWGTGGSLVVLPAGGRPRLFVVSSGHEALRVTLSRVQPEDHAAFERRPWSPEPLPLPGRVVHEGLVAIDDPDTLAEVPIDLSAALPEGRGHVAVRIEPARPRPGETSRVETWVQVTSLGLDVVTDAEARLAWVTSLDTGAPVAGAVVSIGGAQATTDAQGLARLPAEPRPTAPEVVVARHAGDACLLPAPSWWQGPSPGLAWHVFDDRGVYRPGETVRVKGFVRRVDFRKRGDVALAEGVRRIRHVLADSMGNEILEGEVPVTALGGFDLALELPAAMEVGTASLRLEAPGEDAPLLRGIEVQEFRRPEFEVEVEAPPGIRFAGRPAPVAATARYFAGGPLPDSEVAWRVTASETTYRPPGWDGFTFGRSRPWWIARGPGIRPWPGEPAATLSTSARTDGAGVSRVEVGIEPGTPPLPVSVEVEAEVLDVTRRAFADRATFLVHPAEVYVGMKARSPFVGPGEPLELDLIAPGVDGRAVAGRRIVVTCGRVEGRVAEGEWTESLEDIEVATPLSAETPVACAFTPRRGGAHRITATVQDAAGRESTSEITLYVAGGDAPPSRGLALEAVELVPDREQYQPGDVARILVRAPFAPSEALVTLRRSGLVGQQRLSLAGATTIVEVAVEADHVPNVHVQVDLVGRREGAGSGSARPAFASGTLDLPVPPLSRALSVTVTPGDEEVAPGARTSVRLLVRDAAGRPVPGAEACVAVVDEAVLAPTGYEVADPLTTFHPQREPGAMDQRLRDLVVAETTGARHDEGEAGGAGMKSLAAESRMLPMAAAPADAAQDGSGQRAITARTRFDALALWSPVTTTDAAGGATLELTVPDNLTRYRILAVAAARATAFGKGESALTARLPIMVRPSPPRFLSIGDRFEMPVVLQNQGDVPVVARVAARTANLELTGPRGLEVTVPANDRVEIRFPAAAARPGLAHLQVVAAAGAHGDAAMVHWPVLTPATAESFATYGTIDTGSLRLPVVVPDDALPGFGGLEISASSTALTELSDAALYLHRYPFECTEQVASRLLGAVAVRDALEALAEGLPPRAEVDAGIDGDVATLVQRQQEDGSFSAWPGGGAAWPFVSIHATNALVRAREAGRAVPARALDAAARHLEGLPRALPPEYGEPERLLLRAYAIDVRLRIGDPDPREARALAASLPALPLEACGFILETLRADAGSRPELEAVRRHLDNRVVEEAGTAHFATSYGDGDYLVMHSDRRDDAVILEALVRSDPGSDLVPKLARGLLESRSAGRWSTTQENAFALLALGSTFRLTESETPDFTARAWLGGTYAGALRFAGRSRDRQEIRVPMAWLADGPRIRDLVLGKEGPGRLHVRVGLRHAPASLALARRDAGFDVERRYEGVDDPADVRRDGDGWHVRAGARVRVVTTLRTPSRRTHVALVSPLPAGLEPENPGFTTTARGGDSGGRQPAPWWDFRGGWIEHEGLRDDRAEAFTSVLWPGEHEHSFVSRAATPGRFVVAPARAEEMYHPEVFGRSASDIVTVK